MSYMFNSFWRPWFPFPSALNNRKHFMRIDKMSGTVQCFCFHENKWTTWFLSLWKNWYIFYSLIQNHDKYVKSCEWIKQLPYRASFFYYQETIHRYQSWDLKIRRVLCITISIAEFNTCRRDSCILQLSCI